MIRESADLLYNLTVLWAASGVQPEDVWREMERREHLLGIAEKLPKSPVKIPKNRFASGSRGDQLSRLRAAAAQAPLDLPNFRKSPAWTNPRQDG